MLRLLIVIMIGLTVLGCMGQSENALLKLVPPPQDDVAISHTVKIDSLLDYYFDGIKVDSSEVSTRLEQASKTEDEITIALTAHKSVVLNRVISIMDICKDLNIKIRVNSE